MKIQITLFDKNQKYKPIACLLEAESLEQAKANLPQIKKDAYNKIASRKYMTATELFNEGYQIMKMREYDPDKIKQENMIRYIGRKRQEKNQNRG